MSFWTPNIESKGRFARAALGILLITAAILFFRQGWVVTAALLLASGAFCLFEAARGWCVARACKIRTPL
jgi:hypothetical protein